jgi:ABC-2 type transport system permease protein
MLSAYAFINTFSYDFIVKILGTTPKAKMPDIAQQLFKGMQTFNDYTWYSWFGKSYIQIVTLLAVILGMGAIAGEVSKDTISFLLSKPFSRTQVFFSKYISGAILLFFISLVTTVVQFLVGFANKDFNIGLSKFLLAVLNSFPGELMIFSLALLFSTIFADRLKAGLLAGVIAVVLSIPGLIPDYSDYDVYKYFVDQKILTSGNFPWLAFLSLAVASIIIFAIGLKVFQRKQF